MPTQPCASIRTPPCAERVRCRRLRAHRWGREGASLRPSAGRERCRRFGRGMASRAPVGARPVRLPTPACLSLRPLVLVSARSSLGRVWVCLPQTAESTRAGRERRLSGRRHWCASRFGPRPRLRAHRWGREGGSPRRCAGRGRGRRIGSGGLTRRAARDGELRRPDVRPACRCNVRRRPGPITRDMLKRSCSSVGGVRGPQRAASRRGPLAVARAAPRGRRLSPRGPNAPVEEGDHPCSDVPTIATGRAYPSASELAPRALAWLGRRRRSRATRSAAERAARAAIARNPSPP